VAKKQKDDKGSKSNEPVRRETGGEPPAASQARRSRLGRGLSSLMQVDDEPTPSPSTPRETGSDRPAAAEATPAGDAMLHVEPAKIRPNPHQPRKTIGPAALAELAASIKVNGVIQPLVVRRAGDGQFELIAGERRLRASKLAQLDKVPVIVRDVDEAAQAEMALVENIQREDLNPVDRGLAYKALQRRLGATQAELAERLGEERATVQSHLRLLELPEEVVELAREGQLPIGHVKVIAGLPEAKDQVRLARQAAEQGLSVRQLERLSKVAASPEGSKARAEAEARNAYLSQLAGTLSKSIGTECTVSSAGKGGYRLTLTLKNAEQFDRLMERLGVDVDS